MKVLQLVQKPQRRGAEVFAYQLSEELLRQGHELRTLYLYPYPADDGLPLRPQDKVLGGDERHTLEKLPGFHPGLLRRLLGEIQAFEPDVIQVNGARTVKYGAFAARFSRVRRWVVVYRNIDNPAYWITDPWRLFFYRRLVMPAIDGVIGVSEATLKQVRQLYRVQVPAEYIPNGVETAPLDEAPGRAATRQALGVPSGVGVILFIGNLTGQKRPDRFLRVVKQVHRQQPHIQAWLLGDGPQRAELEQQTRQLGLADVARFWGYRDQVGPYIAAAELLLVTSDSDGIPAVVLEAGYLGLPTVGTRVGGLPECVLEGETGLLFPPEDETGLAQAILHLLDQPDHLAEMGQKAKCWVQTNFTMEIIAQKYFNFYQQIISATNRVG